MIKIVINSCYGGFGLSDKAVNRLAEIGNSVAISYQKKCESDPKYKVVTKNCHSFSSISRTDPDLVRVVEELGDEASGLYAGLSVVEIPDDVDWMIEEYDGQEWVAEKHRTWG